MLVKILLKNQKLFAWMSNDISSIHIRVMSHKLPILKETRPITQKKRKLGEERRKYVEVEVKTL